jgi:HEAT repeat protein
VGFDLWDMLAPSMRVLGTAFLLAAGLSRAGAPAEPSAGQLLEQFKASANFHEQLELAKRIVALHDVRVLPELTEWLEHPDRHLRGNAAFIFAGLGDPRGLTVITGILTDVSADRTLGTGWGVAPGDLRYRLAPQIEYDRYYAVHLLGALKNPEAVPDLLALLHDETVNYNAAWALGEIGDGRAIRPLIGALKDSDARMRVSAIHALEKLQAREAVPHLRALLSDHALPRGRGQITVGETARLAIGRLEP